MSYPSYSLPKAQTRFLGQRRLRPRIWNSTDSFLTDAGIFVLGASGIYSLNVIGSLPGCEVIALALLPVMLLAKGKRAFDRQYLPFYLAVGGWLLGTLIADEYNDIPWALRAKGTARVVFFAIDFVALAILLNNRTRRFVVFILSIAATLGLASRSVTYDFAVQWKFGVSHAFTIVSLFVSGYFYVQRKYWVCIGIALVVAGLNFHYGSRSQLLIDLTSTVLAVPIFEAAQTQRNHAPPKQSLAKTLVLLTMIVGVAYLANFAIKWGAQRGMFDEANNEKFQAQASGDYGVLVGGRPETLVAIQAIRDAPLIGHGSFPFGVKYLQMEQDIQYEHGYSGSDDPEETDSPVIPTHSHLTLGWVEGGILGGICWIYIFILVARSVLRLATLRSALSPIYAYLLVNFLWDILYSPFGSVNRVHAAFLILLSYSILRKEPADGVAKRQFPGKTLLPKRQLYRLTGTRGRVPGSGPGLAPGRWSAPNPTS
jgi:hypothetical protein